MKKRAYLDVETTGLSRHWYELTVIGIGLEKRSGIRMVQLVEENLSGKKLLGALKGVDVIYTYNGKRFDLPSIKTHLGVDLAERFEHRDLMYDCWRHSLKGGLKAVERKLGIERVLKGIDGYMAVQLWWEYINESNLAALETLLAYNREDIVNLATLRKKLRVR